MKQRVKDFLRKGRKGGILRKLLAWYLRRTRPLIFYHGTSDVYIASIRKEINPPTGANFEGLSQFGEGFYTTTSKMAAAVYEVNC